MLQPFLQDPFGWSLMVQFAAGGCAQYLLSYGTAGMQLQFYAISRGGHIQPTPISPVVNQSSPLQRARLVLYCVKVGQLRCAPRRTAREQPLALAGAHMYRRAAEWVRSAMPLACVH